MAEEVNVSMTWKEFKAWKEKHLRRNGLCDNSRVYGVSNKSGNTFEFTFGLFKFDMPDETTIKEIKDEQEKTSSS